MLKDLKAYAGYISDLIHLLTFSSKNPYSYTKFKIVDHYRKLSGATTFIETGTYKGIMSYRCSRKFDEVITVELDEKYYQMSSERLKKRSNVTCLKADALAALPELLDKTESRNLMIFLDGHFSGGDTASGEMPEPSAELLIKIVKNISKIKVIIIDDFRCYDASYGCKKSQLFSIAENYYLDQGFDVRIFMDQMILWRTSK